MVTHNISALEPSQTENDFENGRATPLALSSPSNIRTSLRRIASFTFFFVALGAFFILQAIYDSLQVVFTDILGSDVDVSVLLWPSDNRSHEADRIHRTSRPSLTPKRTGRQATRQPLASINVRLRLRSLHLLRSTKNNTRQKRVLYPMLL